MKGHPYTKIYATIGPATWDEDVLKQMIGDGMYVARINASHADAAEIERVAHLIRKISPRVAVLVDTMGYKIRVTGFDNNKELTTGQEVVLVSAKHNSRKKDIIEVTYPTLEEDLEVGTKVMIDDGNLQLEVAQIEDKFIHCKVLVGGTLKPNKTVNIPGAALKFPDIPDKDKEDIAAAVSVGADFLAASFVRNVEDVRTFKKEMGETDIKLIAKIEDVHGVENFDEILDEVDGIMIARGDLGVEKPIQEVPLLQKMFIHKCRQKGKFSIVATQMLESMIEQPTPTRAEASDIANAIMDGTDAVMLSAETSVGKYPTRAVKVMRDIAHEVESVLQPQAITGTTEASDITDMLSLHIPQMVSDMDLKGIIMFTHTGKSIQSLSRHRLNVPIWAISTNPKLIRQMHTYRGVFGTYIKDIPNDRDAALMKAVDVVYGGGYLDLQDKVGVFSGSWIKGKRVNSIFEVTTVGDVINM